MGSGAEYQHGHCRIIIGAFLMEQGILHMARLTIMAFLLFLPLGMSAALADDKLYIIANLDVPINKLSKSEINRIFLLKQTSWDNGLAIIPVNREASSRVRMRFSNLVLGRSPRSLSSYWNQMHFKGYMPPIIQESDAAVIAFIQSVSGAIGYIHSNKVPDNVKKLGEFE